MKNIPNHIAFILDGNRRWAKANNKPVLSGHKAGVASIRNIIKESVKIGINYISLYAFSTENWNRSKLEQQLLFKLFEDVLKNEFHEMIDEGIKLIHIGRKDRLPKNLKNLLDEMEIKSKDNNTLTIYLSLDYGGRDEIVRAVNKAIKNGEKELTEEQLENYLDMPKPYPDLLIRTSNEFRLSNFLLWQLAYSEFIFVDKFLPDFSIEDFHEVLEIYKKRIRRFGK